MTKPEHRTPDSVWNAWGTADAASPLSADVRTLVEQGLGITHRDTQSVDRADISLRPCALPAEARGALAEIVGADRVRTDDDTRLLHAGGKSTPDLLRRRAGDVESVPTRSCSPARTTRSARSWKPAPRSGSR